MAGNLGISLIILAILNGLNAFSNIEIEIDSLSAETIEMDHAKEFVPHNSLGKHFSLYFLSNSKKIIVLKGYLNKRREKQGEWKLFDTQENLKVYCKFNRHETIKNYCLYQQGELRLIKEKKTGNTYEVTSFYSNGELRESKTIRGEQLIGKYRKYKPSGQKDIEGKYKRRKSEFIANGKIDGTKKGKWKYYSNNEKLIKVITFRRGTMISSVKHEIIF